MANLTLFPARNSSLPLIIIFLLLNSLLNQLHSSSYEESEATDEIEEEGRLEKSLEPKFALHKWAHGYTCSYRFNFTALWCIFVSSPNIIFPCSNVLASGTLGLCVPTVWSGLSCGNALVDRGGSPSRYNNYFWSTLQSGVFSKLFNTWLFRTWGLVLVDFRPASWRAATALKLAENAELVVVRGGEPGGVGAWPQDWLRSRWSQFSRTDL